MSKPILDQRLAIQAARNAGCKVFKCSPKWLLLDLDSDIATETYENTLPIIQEDLNVIEHRRWQSKSGNWHVLLKLPRPLPVEQRMLLQAILGSDLMREWYSLLRVWNGCKEPSLLFEPPRRREPAPQESHPNYDPGPFPDDDVPF